MVRESAQQIRNICLNAVLGSRPALARFFLCEILSITGITITENSLLGKGARFEITVPKDGYRFIKK
jgi:hypothetical protein